MNKIRLISLLTVALALGLSLAQAQPMLIAVGSLTESRAGANADLSGLTYSLENQAPANLLGGLGSAITYNSGSKFLLLPDRGPNAVTFDAAIDNTVSYVNRFHTNPNQFFVFGFTDEDLPGYEPPTHGLPFGN
jgi:hypothetical protein